MDKLKNFLDKHSNEGTPTSFSNVFNTKDSSYQVRIFVDDNRRDYTILHFRIPDEFALEVTASWTSLVEKLTGSLFKGAELFTNAVKDVADFANAALATFKQTNLGNPVLSAQTYKGSSPLKLHFDFDLAAYGSATNEILNPIKALIALTLPYQKGLSPVRQLNASMEGSEKEQAESMESFFEDLKNGTTLQLPGPGLGTILRANYFPEKVAEGFATGTSIYVQIANYFLCGPVFIKSVKPTFKNRLDTNGLPTMGKISIDFETAYTMTSGQVTDCFIG
jgi:hypothetical protein